MTLKTLITALVFLSSSMSFAHRDSDVDNFKECSLNKDSLNDGRLEVSCNDLYHLYVAKGFKARRRSALKIGAYNIFKLGSGDSRFKDFDFTAKLIKNYDVVAVSEMHHATSEDYDSNQNLLKHPELDFKKYYQKPGYLKLLLKLRESNKSWSLIISPVGQSDNEELLGFYFRSDRVALQNSEYCKSYNRNIRKKNNLVFAGGVNGPKFERESVTPHLNKSYACLLDLDKGENDIFRVPFSARFKVGSGFDFQMLSTHVRFAAPIAVRGSCGFECLEKVNSFLNTTFHKEGAFLKVLDSRALSFLKKHMDFISLSKSPTSALYEEYGSVIRFKYSKPRVYKRLIEVKELLKKALPNEVDRVWNNSYKDEITKKDKDYIKKQMLSLFSNLNGYDEFKKFIKDSGKIYKTFLGDIVQSGIFAETGKRYKIWISPEKIARFNELSITLKEMEKIAEREKDKDVVLGGDINLEDAKNRYYWDFFKDNYKYSDIAIGSKTSVGETNGLRSAYDHFIYDGRDSMEECLPLEATVLDFVNDKDYWDDFNHYFVKSKSDIDKVSKIQRKRIEDIVYIDSKGKPTSPKDMVVKRGYTSCWTGETIKPASLADVWVNSFECKTLNQFVNGPQRFRLYTDIVSDHLPIGMKCSKTSDLD